MAFRIKRLGAQEPETFSVVEILKLLGDKVNDEIRINGLAYRLSSVQEIGGGSDPGPTERRGEEMAVSRVHRRQRPLVVKKEAQAQPQGSEQGAGAEKRRERACSIKLNQALCEGEIVRARQKSGVF